MNSALYSNHNIPIMPTATSCAKGGRRAVEVVNEVVNEAVNELCVSGGRQSL